MPNIRLIPRHPRSMRDHSQQKIGTCTIIIKANWVFLFICFVVPRNSILIISLMVWMFGAHSTKTGQRVIWTSVRGQFRRPTVQQMEERRAMAAPSEMERPTVTRLEDQSSVLWVDPHLRCRPPHLQLPPPHPDWIKAWPAKNRSIHRYEFRLLIVILHFLLFISACHTNASRVEHPANTNGYFSSSYTLVYFLVFFSPLTFERGGVPEEAHLWWSGRPMIAKERSSELKTFSSSSSFFSIGY